MTVHVVAVSSRTPDPIREPYYRFHTFVESLMRFDFAPTILGADEPWRGLMTKPNCFLKWLRENDSVLDRVIFCDAWDTVFVQHPQQIASNHAMLFGDAVLFNAEKACWPLAELAHHFEDTGSPWRYLNGGIIIGRNDRMLALFESMPIEEMGFDRQDEQQEWINPNDQVLYLNAFVAQPVPIVVDAKCEIAQCLSACQIDEFDLTGEHVVNNVTGTSPSIFHFNGGSKDVLMPQMLAKWGLS